MRNGCVSLLENEPVWNKTTKSNNDEEKSPLKKKLFKLYKKEKQATCILLFIIKMLSDFWNSSVLLWVKSKHVQKI